jgi:hypothetical protein
LLWDGSAPHPAARIYNYLERRFPDCRLLWTSTTWGLDRTSFRRFKSSVDSCDILVAVIGSKWVTAIDKEGNRRLDNRQDFVRLEVLTALKRGIRVIPVLVDDALILQGLTFPLTYSCWPNFMRFKLVTIGSLQIWNRWPPLSKASLKKLRPKSENASGPNSAKRSARSRTTREGTAGGRTPGK